MSELLAGVELLLQDDSKVDAGEFLKGKIVGLYFSAGWCGPCRQFTPKLKRFYSAIKEKHDNFEVIFISRDREEDDLLEYFKDHHGEWATIPFGNPKIQELLEKYEVKTIPSMRVIKADGSVVSNDARTEIQDKSSEPEELFEEWETFFSM